MYQITTSQAYLTNRNIFEYDGLKYHYINYEDFTVEMLPLVTNYKKSSYLNLGCGFDIETTKSNDKSFMYVWQMSLDDMTIIGRTWEQFKELLQKVSEYYQLNTRKKILCYIHNMSYEWAFFKSQIKWRYDNIYEKLDVFAIDNRKVIKATSNTFFEFRDSLILTNKPLKDLPSTYNLSVKKLVDEGQDLYKIQINSQTPLTNEQIAYCINDVQILQQFFHKYIKEYYLKNGHKIPLTATGIVRMDLKASFKTLPKKEREKWHNYLNHCTLSENNYKVMMKWVYRGGLVKSMLEETDILHINQDMHSFDLKSSYPSSMLHELYPYRFCKKTPEYYENIKGNRWWNKTHAFMGEFIFEDIRSKTLFSLESKHKILDVEGGYFDNGRLMSAKKIRVALTEIDMMNYEDVYIWEKCTCISLLVSDKHPLPHYLKDIILKYFVLKESLDKDSLDYTITKYKLNGLYGMCVTGLVEKELIFDGQQFNISNQSKSYFDLTNNQILLPQWGCWVSAFSRRLLVRSFCKTNGTMYGDTDSNKQKNTYGNMWFFNAHNDYMHRLNKTMYVGDYDRKYFYNIGCFEDEGKLFKFKTLGCKRYVDTVSKYNKDKKKFEIKNEVTIAGLPKKVLSDEAKEKNKDIYDLFKDGLEFDITTSNKLTSKYIDEPFEFVHKDYLGNECAVAELSAVVLEEIPFSMSMTLEYLAIIKEYQEKNKIICGERILG